MIEVYDIESYNGLFLYMGLDIESRRWVGFEVSDYKNELDGLVKHLRDDNIEYAVSFNGLSYDSQVLQYILDNHERWVDYDNRRIVRLIKKFSNKVIDDTSYGLFPPYREEQLEVKQIDLFRIHHYDNKQRRCSLKWLQFSMDSWSVEETPIPFEREEFTEQEVEIVKSYCKNDIQSTYEFWTYTIGNVKHDMYRGKNKVQDRHDLIEEFGFPKKAISWSDVKIGDEINKKVYMGLTGVEDPRKLVEMKKDARRRRGFTYGDCIAPYVKFKTPQFQEFYNMMKNVKVNLMEKEKFPFTHNGTQYIIAKGGIHSTEKNRSIIPGIDEILMDADVGSQYPHSIIKRGLYPSHLGKSWLVGYTQTRDKRLVYKEKGKDDRKYKGLADMYKLALNGGGFGMTNQKDNWQYDPFVQFSCTIGNQFELLMLIESLETNGIHVVSANTDGIVCLFNKDKKDTYFDICSQWEKIVGNDVQGKLEFTEYAKLIQSSVNHYIAIKPDGKVKKKGSFSTETELNQDKSGRIIPMALEEYYTKGISVEKTITSNRNIFNFLIGVKASSNYHYEMANSSGEAETYNKVVRYYVSTNGKKIFKVKNPMSEADGAEISQCEAGIWKCTIANEVDTGDDIRAYKINYEYYIEKAQEVIDNIARGKKGVKINKDKNQISMF